MKITEGQKAVVISFHTSFNYGEIVFYKGVKYEDIYYCYMFENKNGKIGLLLEGEFVILDNNKEEINDVNIKNKKQKAMVTVERKDSPFEYMEIVEFTGSVRCNLFNEEQYLFKNKNGKLGYLKFNEFKLLKDIDDFNSKEDFINYLEHDVKVNSNAEKIHKIILDEMRDKIINECLEKGEYDRLKELVENGLFDESETTKIN